MNIHDSKIPIGKAMSKPRECLRCGMAKAGALIAAEVDRLLRAARKQPECK